MAISEKCDYLEFYDPNSSDTRKEDAHQVDCVSWLRYRHPELLFFHPVNEGKKSIVSALRDEQAGLLKGVSDFIILTGRDSKYPFAAIELKRANKSGKGKATPVSKEQREFLQSVRFRGGFAAVAYGFEQFKVAIEKMLE